MAESVSAPRPDSVALGHQCREGSPIRSRKTGAVSSPTASPPRATARYGWRLRVRAHRSQIVGAWYQASRRASQRGVSMARPRTARSAGRSVTESRTATATTTRPLSPMLRVSTIGGMRSAANPTSTVAPDVMTAVPAVTRVRRAASCRRAPRLSSSRNRVTISSE